MSRPGNLTRRGFLLGTSASAMLFALPRQVSAQKPTDATILTAAPWQVDLEGAGATTDVFAYNRSVPGPVLRGKVGEPLKVLLDNNLGEPTTVHWHGVRLDNAMDGVPGMTQDPIPHAGTFLYEFTPPDPGTYWYHPHLSTSRQAAMGLAGPLIIEEQEPPAVEHDMVLVLDDWRLDKDGQIHQESFGDLHEAAHGGRFGNTLTVNGKPQVEKIVMYGDLIRIRIINVANANIFGVGVEGLNGHVVALDGRGTTPIALDERPLVVGPAQRVDIIVTPRHDVGRGAIVLVGGDRKKRIATLMFDGEPDGRDRSTAIDLEGRQPDLGEGEPDTRVALPLDGGAMGSMRAARHDGQTKTWRGLVESGMVWSMAGEAGYGDTPLFEVKRGALVEIAIPNNTAWPHAMHVHGHHFRIKSGGVPGDLGRVRDTVLALPEEETVIAFRAENVGDWLIHCHMLSHAETGMTTWFRVV